MHRLLAAGLAGLALLVAVPSDALAQTPDPRNAEVSIRNQGGRLVVRFPAVRWSKLAGRRLRIECEGAVPLGGPVLLRAAKTVTAEGQTLTLPRRRKPVKTLSGASAYDLCSVLVRGRRSSRSTVLAADVPVTAAGVTALEERTLGAALAAVLGVVGERAKGGAYPAAGALTDDDVAEFSSFDGLEALPGPDASPTAPHAVGVWTDGAQRAVAVTVTQGGRRLFVAADGETLSTNVPDGLAGGD